jgi:hypothetical protein
MEVDKLRDSDYAVAVVKDYEAAREMILDCAKFIKKWENTKNDKYRCGGDNRCR